MTPRRIQKLRLRGAERRATTRAHRAACKMRLRSYDVFVTWMMGSFEGVALDTNAPPVPVYDRLVHVPSDRSETARRRVPLEAALARYTGKDTVQVHIELGPRPPFLGRWRGPR